MTTPPGSGRRVMAFAFQSMMRSTQSMSDLHSPKARDTRERILDAAERAFADAGFAGAGLRRIAADAGVTQPLVLHYFDNKRALFDAVLGRAAATYVLERAPLFELPVDDVRFFSVGLVALFDWLGARPRILRLAAWARLEGVVPTPLPLDEMWGHVRRRLEQGQATGLIRHELDVSSALLVIDALMKGYWERQAVYQQHGLLRDEGASRREVLRALLLYLLSPHHHDAALARLPASDSPT